LGKEVIVLSHAWCMAAFGKGYLI